MIQTDSQPEVTPKTNARSRISNGACLLPGVDGRSTWVRRTRDLIQAHTNDLGGLSECSQAEQSMIRRAAVLTTELEQLEVIFAQAGQATERQLDLYARISSGLRRLLEAVGLERRAKRVPGAPVLLGDRL